MNEELIKDLLNKADESIELINTHEDEALENLKHSIYDTILNHLQIEDDMDIRDPYYEILFNYELRQINQEQVINKLKLI
ncbi:hypothetical protein [Aquibacillus saliphilus]|uniref:hypothetical protein n=1 Tax=Aquibacillus saliphilus TaxID=1909422 RepID=UPI001CEFB374|nr:hypothetical protein [Aquibacillus saliphilus]